MIDPGPHPHGGERRRRLAAFKFYWQPLEITHPPREEIADWLEDVAKVVARQHATTIGLTISFGAEHVAMIVPPIGDPYHAQGRMRIEGPFIDLRIDASRWANSPRPEDHD